MIFAGVTAVAILKGFSMPMFLWEICVQFALDNVDPLKSMFSIWFKETVAATPNKYDDKLVAVVNRILGIK